MSVWEKFSRMISLNAGQSFHPIHQNTPETLKTITAALILLAAIALPLHAASPLPATSSVTLKQTKTAESDKKPTGENRPNGHEADCFGDWERYTLQPTFTRGLDAKSSPLVMNIYLMMSNKNGEVSIRKPNSQIISSDPTIPLVADTNYRAFIRWHCKCRTRGDAKDKAPEWYAEVTQDGKVLCSTQSKSNSEIRKLIETRKIISEVEVKALPVSTNQSGIKPN